MRLWERYQARRRRKIREAHLAEKARQAALNGQDDVQGAVRHAATGQAGTQAGLVAGTR